MYVGLRRFEISEELEPEDDKRQEILHKLGENCIPVRVENVDAITAIQTWMGENPRVDLVTTALDLTSGQEAYDSSDVHGKPL